MSNLRRTIEDQAVQFASAIVNALRSASIEELMGVTGGGRAVSRGAAPRTTGAPPRGRRTVADIAKTLEQIVSVLAKHPEGLRAEQIKAALQLDKTEMPKPIAEGLSSGRLTKKGQKRATTYYAGAGGATRAAPKKRATKRAAAKK